MTPAVPVNAGSPDLGPDLRQQAALLRPLRIPWIACLVWRETTSFSFTVASSVVSLEMVDMSFAMAAHSLDVAAVRFVITCTVSW